MDIDRQIESKEMASHVALLFRLSCRDAEGFSAANAAYSTIRVISIFVTCLFMISSWRSNEAPASLEDVSTPSDFYQFALDAIARSERESEKRLLADADGYISIIESFYQHLRENGYVGT